MAILNSATLTDAEEKSLNVIQKNIKKELCIENERTHPWWISLFSSPNSEKLTINQFMRNFITIKNVADFYKTGRRIIENTNGRHLFFTVMNKLLLYLLFNTENGPLEPREKAMLQQYIDELDVLLRSPALSSSSSVTFFARSPDTNSESTENVVPAAEPKFDATV